MPPDPIAPPPALHRWLPQVYYGWLIVVGTSLLAFVVVGVGFYGLAVFLDGLCREHGWPQSSVALATTLFFVSSGVFGTVVGRWVDRLGPRVFFVPGAVAMGLALLWIGRLDEAWELYLAYLLLSLGYAMAGAVPSSALITRWFVARRAFAMSISQTGVSLGGVVLVPVMTALIVSRGMANATALLAGLVVVVAAAASLWIIRSDPESMGLAPDGGVEEETPRGLDLAQQRRVWPWREAMATRTFWIAVVAFSGILFCQVATAMHQIALLRERMDATSAAFAVSVTATGSILARLAVGTFADRLSKRLLTAVLMIVQAGAIATLALADAPALLFGASLVFGFTIGNLFMLQSLIVGELFGMVSFGTVFGLLQLVTQTVSGLGPWVLSLLVAALGSYRAGLLPLVGLALVSACVVTRLRPPSPAISR